MLLVGGTDGGNAEVLLACADDPGRPGWRGPVVVAGNVDAQDEVAALLDGGRDAVRARRQRGPADRRAGPGLGPRRDPGDVPAARDRRQAPVAARRLHRDGPRARRRTWCSPRSSCSPGLDAEHPGAGDVVVVDVGGATTDVHSVVELDPEDAGLAREVVATVPVSRTVEGDLGMRWSAVPTVEEGLAAGLLDGRRRGCGPPPAYGRPTRRSCPAPGRERDDDEAIAAAAVGVALRRHAGRSQVVLRPRRAGVVERSGKDLREVDLLVGSGGVLRNNAGRRRRAGPRGGHRRRTSTGGWQLPRAPARRSSTTTTCWPRPGCWRADAPGGARTPCWHACG